VELKKKGFVTFFQLIKNANMKTHLCMIVGCFLFIPSSMLIKELGIANAEEQASFSLCLTTDKIEYTVGEPVCMTITAVNCMPVDLHFNFMDAQRFDFI
jgi:hypothetical protein